MIILAALAVFAVLVAIGAVTLRHIGAVNDALDAAEFETHTFFAFLWRVVRAATLAAYWTLRTRRRGSRSLKTR